MVLSTLLALTAGLANIGQSQSLQPLEYERTGSFEAPRLRESSGVAVSRSQPGVIWTHNDSGDGPRLYATNLAGEDLGVYELEGVDAVDWEDLATGPCPTRVGHDWCLYVSDTGDNFESREYVAIHVVPEPQVYARDGGGTNTAVHSIRITYPDRARDAEAIVVFPSGDVYVITKGRTPPVVVYGIPRESLAEAQAVAAVIDTLPIDSSRGLFAQVTAAAISPAGTLLAVRTYTQLHFFSTTGGFRVAGPACDIGLRQPQGEAVDFLTPNEFVLTSETALGREGGIARVTCQTPKDDGIN